MSTKPAQTSTTHQAGTTVQVAPSSLLLDRNIREAKPDADLIKSVTEVGVLQPVVAVVTAAGDLRVRYGARRTHAAIQAHTETIPVYVAGVEGTEQADEVLRIITQRDENTHRTALSTADEVGVVEQLAALGLSPAQMATQARISRSQVDAALAVAGSDLARKATDRYADLTLDQAAVVAEFQDEPETVKALIVAAAEGKFDHVAQRARDDRDRTAQQTAIRAALTEQGVTVLEEAPGYDATPRPLSSLTAGPEEHERLTVEDHGTCPGHVAWLADAWTEVGPDGQPVQWPEEPEDVEEHDDPESEAAWAAYEKAYEKVRQGARRVRQVEATYGCADPAAHGHHDPYRMRTRDSGKVKATDLLPAEREAAKAARALVIENNKAWDAAEVVRREWVATHLAKAKTPPKGTFRFLATALCADAHTIASVGGNQQAADWLGKTHDGYGHIDLSPAKTATDQRCQVIALVQVLGDYERDLTRDSWRRDGTHNTCGRYLRFLQTAGYTLSDVETYAISASTA